MAFVQLSAAFTVPMRHDPLLAESDVSRVHFSSIPYFLPRNADSTWIGSLTHVGSKTRFLVPYGVGSLTYYLTISATTSGL